MSEKLTEKTEFESAIQDIVMDIMDIETTGATIISSIPTTVLPITMDADLSLRRSTSMATYPATFHARELASVF